MGSINKNKIVKKSRDTGTLKWKSEGQEWGCRPMQMSVFYINCLYFTSIVTFPF